MKKEKSSLCKNGKFSTAQGAVYVCQEVVSRKISGSNLEVQTPRGDVVFSYALTEPSAGHQITPDGKIVYVLTGGRAAEQGIVRTLSAVHMQDGSIRKVGETSGHLPAVNQDHMAFFQDGKIIIENHTGERLYEWYVSHAENVSGENLLRYTFLSPDKLAFTCGHRGKEKIADLTVLNYRTGEKEASIEIPVAASHSAFFASALNGDPQGRLVAMTGMYAGLLIIDLEKGSDVAENYLPEKLDLADGRPTLHSHHVYSSFSFNYSGNAMAATYSPGKLSVWNRKGDVLLREWVTTNPRAQRVATFDSDSVAFLDSTGIRALFEQKEFYK